jgi:hypothetical protein
MRTLHGTGFPAETLGARGGGSRCDSRPTSSATRHRQQRRGKRSCRASQVERECRSAVQAWHALALTVDRRLPVRAPERCRKARQARRGSPLRTNPKARRSVALSMPAAVGERPVGAGTTGTVEATTGCPISSPATARTRRLEARPTLREPWKSPKPGPARATDRALICLCKRGTVHTPADPPPPARAVRERTDASR